MDLQQIVYPLLTLVIAYLIFLNARKSFKYKKENVTYFFEIVEDDKNTRLISSLMIAILLVISGLMIMGMIYQVNTSKGQLIYLIILPALMTILYFPMIRRTRISTLGIHKRSNLIRWEDIKGIDFLKPNKKNIIKVKILYNVSGTSTSSELSFLNGNDKLEKFKEISKEYRKDKKKEKKSGK